MHGACLTSCVGLTGCLANLGVIPMAVTVDEKDYPGNVSRARADIQRAYVQRLNPYGQPQTAGHLTVAEWSLDVQA